MINQNTEVRRQKTVGAARRVARFRGLPLFGGTGILPVTGWKPVPPCGRPGQPRRVAPTRPFGFLTALSLITALFASACGSGGGSGVTGPSSTGNTVYAARNSSLSGGDTVTVDVKVSSVSNVYGAAFDVDFDSSKMTYSSYSAGSFLEQGGGGVTYLVSPQSGKLVVGISKQGAVSGVSGSGTLVTLKFNVTGSSTVAFSNNSLKDPSNQPISGIVWSGGSVGVQ